MGGVDPNSLVTVPHALWLVLLLVGIDYGGRAVDLIQRLAMLIPWIGARVRAYRSARRRSFTEQVEDVQKPLRDDLAELRRTVAGLNETMQGIRTAQENVATQVTPNHGEEGTIAEIMQRLEKSVDKHVDEAMRRFDAGERRFEKNEATQALLLRTQDDQQSYIEHSERAGYAALTALGETNAMLRTELDRMRREMLERDARERRRGYGWRLPAQPPEDSDEEPAD